MICKIIKYLNKGRLQLTHNLFTYLLRLSDEMPWASISSSVKREQWSTLKVVTRVKWETPQILALASDFTPALCPRLYGSHSELEIISLALNPTARGQQARHIHRLNLRLTAGTEVISGLSTGGWSYCTRRMWRPASLTRAENAGLRALDQNCG